MKLIASLTTLSIALWLTGCGLAPQQSQAPQKTVQMATATPIVVSNSPANFVATNRLIYVTFSRDMDASTINTETFQVSGLSGAVRYDAANRMAYFTPGSLMQPSTTYTVTLSKDIKAANGYAMPIPYVFKFTTRTTTDTSAPSVMLASTGCVKAGGPVNVVFDEPMDSSTINTSTFLVDGVTGTVTYNPVNRVASFTPDVPFADNTTYNGTITTGAKDDGEVPLASDYHFTFTTCPTGGGGGGSYCSYTKGGYAHEGAPGKFFDQYFPQVFFNDLILGVWDGSGSQTSTRFTAAAPGPANLKTYLTSPAGGPSGPFPADVVNPTATVNGELPEQTATLALNIGFSGMGSDPSGFGDLVLTGTGTSLDGSSVSDILGFANYALAGDGLPDGYTFSSLNDLVDNLNQSWDDCQQDGWAKTHLKRP